jgi:hypothetical protein
MLLQSALMSIKLLQPGVPSDLTADTTRFRAWSLSFMSLASMMDDCFLPNPEDGAAQQQDEIQGNAIALRILLDHIMPILREVAPVQQCGIGTSSAARTSAGNQESSSFRDRDTSCCTGSTSSSSSPYSGMPVPLAAESAHAAQGPSSSGSVAAGDGGGTRNTARTPALAQIPADIALSLLAAASGTVGHCWSEATSSEHAYRILSRGLQHVGANAPQAAGSDAGTVPSGQPSPAGALPEADDMVDTLDAVLSLTYSLISRGPWWQEAKAQYPLLLIDTLYMTYMVSMSCHVLCLGMQVQHVARDETNAVQAGCG